jgi:hypothetical protein
VTLHDSWYKTVRGWFNELQLVHDRTPEQIRQAVVDRTLDVLPVADQLALLTKTYGKMAASPSRIKTSLDKRFVKDGVVLGLRRFQQEGATWSLRETKAPPNTEWWYDDGQLHWKRFCAKDLPKQDLLVLLKDVLTPETFHTKRKVSAGDIAVLVEVLFRTRQKSSGIE